MERGDRLRTEGSGEFRAVDRDLGFAVGEDLPRPSGYLLRRKIERARKVSRRVGFWMQHVHDGKRRSVQPTAQLLARDLRYVS
jgi:hypothetical protein